MTQLADETLFLVYPKKELDSKFLVDGPASALRRKRTRLTSLLFSTTTSCRCLSCVMCSVFRFLDLLHQ